MFSILYKGDADKISFLRSGDRTARQTKCEPDEKKLEFVARIWDKKMSTFNYPISGSTEAQILHSSRVNIFALTHMAW